MVRSTGSAAVKRRAQSSCYHRPSVAVVIYVDSLAIVNTLSNDSAVRSAGDCRRSVHPSEPRPAIWRTGKSRGDDGTAVTGADHIRHPRQRADRQPTAWLARTACRVALARSERSRPTHCRQIRRRDQQWRYLIETELAWKIVRVVVAPADQSPSRLAAHGHRCVVRRHSGSTP